MFLIWNKFSYLQEISSFMYFKYLGQKDRSYFQGREGKFLTKQNQMSINAIQIKINIETK